MAKYCVKIAVKAAACYAIYALPFIRFFDF
jgi:hypothetical protein